MAYKSGKVETITLKEERDGKYGKFAGYGMKIGEEWFNSIANTVKSLGRVAVVDKNYNEIKEGMEVEFMYTVNEKGYKDIDRKTLLITASGSAVKPEPPAEQPASPSEDLVKQERELVNKFCDGLAALVAAYKFKGKEKPSPDQIDRVSDFIKKIFK